MLGNVHAFTAVRLNDKLQGEKNYPHPLVRINLLRHPVTRVDSYASHCARQARGDASVARHIDDAVEGNSGYHSLKQLMLSRYSVDFTLRENRYFIFATIVLGNDISDTKIPCEHICYERLVSDIEYFQWFFYTLTGGNLKPNDAVLASFRGTSLKNTTHTQMRTSLETVRRWEPWKTFLLRTVFETAPEMLQLYRGLNYDLDPVFDDASDTMEQGVRARK